MSGFSNPYRMVLALSAAVLYLPDVEYISGSFKLFLLSCHFHRGVRTHDLVFAIRFPADDIHSIAGTCSIKANTVSEPDLNGCSWDKSTKTLVVFVTVQFTPIIETIQDKENAVTIADKVKMKFFECGSSGGSKRNAVLIEILDRGPVDTNIIITNATHISGDDPSIGKIRFVLFYQAHIWKC